MLVKMKHIQWQKSIIQSLLDLESNNPKEYWNLITCLKRANSNSDSSSNDSDAVDSATWFEYFKQMSQRPDFIHDDFQTNIKKVINNYEIFAHSFVEILDKNISESDVKAAVSIMKVNKSAAMI